MNITVLTLFPEMFAPLKESIIGRAISGGKLNINIVNIRDYAENKHLKCDDYPFGGGAGMVMMPQPIGSAIEAADPDHRAHRIFLSPRGRTFNQKIAVELAQKNDLLLLCGHYEGVDQRVIDMYIDEELSLGDFVLTGGELPAMVVCDCVARYVDGVISGESLKDESFAAGMLEYPQYTRPAVYKGVSVPEVLLSGNHGEVEKWRRQKSLEITQKNRPDLLK
ncbi:MAG TPA: tRNA (guanosine(37)-N1)-methyltransferase TrmD [Candidatus Coproplasma excrementigallinarum]|uniref:tRNA (guanine-N(1)-)-methyltransferase n=1 Tax=Candidatus Coproplasma excrementigallinarum TaxID=2840747 RepID=A0A9D1MK14_9FIRM|nr:tRNA (guanosine(37)-N1)-methyltransferase TrmD [Candidatus Coproplasma excrementigallinarum]